MRLAAAFSLGLVAAIVAAEPAHAQRILDRVEKFIEKQVLPRLDQATAPGGAPGAAPGSPGAYPAAPGAAGAIPVAAEAGYFGVVADDSDTANRGARVTGLRGGGPAEAAGLRMDDLIYAINGKAVRNLEEMGTALAGLPVGARAEVFFERGGKRMATTVTLSRRPDAAAPVAPREPGALPSLGLGARELGGDVPVRAARPVVPATPPVLGVRAVTVPDAARLGYGLFARRGAVITSIEVGSAADRAGLALGNVVVSLHGATVNDPAGLSEAMRTVRWGDEAVIQFYRGDKLLQTRIAFTPPGPVLPDTEPALDPGLPAEDPPLFIGPKITEFPRAGRPASDPAAIAPLDPSRIPPPDPRLGSELPAPPPPPKANPPLPAEGTKPVPPSPVPPIIDELQKLFAPGPPAAPAPNLVERPTPERVRTQIAELEDQLARLKVEATQIQTRLAELRKTLDDLSKPALPPDAK